MNEKIMVECEGMKQENIDELYYQISLKANPYGATMYKHSKGKELKERKIGSILMSAKGLRKLADSMDMIYPKQTIKLPLWKFQDSVYFQLDEGTGAINLKGE